MQDIIPCIYLCRENLPSKIYQFGILVCLQEGVFFLKPLLIQPNDLKEKKR